MLRQQQTKAQRLLSERPILSPIYEAWKNTTRAYLVQCFGSESENVDRFMSAGMPGSISFLRSRPASAADLEAEMQDAMARSIEAKIAMLGSCIEQLESGVAFLAQGPATAPTAALTLGATLEPEQCDLLSALVEASRSLPRDRRGKFTVQIRDGRSLLIHEGLPGGQTDILFSDAEALGYLGLVAIEVRTPGERGSRFIWVTPQGYTHYEELKRQAGEPVQQVDVEIRAYVDSHSFRARYSAAHEKWTQAANMLWSTDSQCQSTTIGHLCSEALQQFASKLVERVQPPQVDSNREHTIARLKSVIEHRRGDIPTTVRPFLDALIRYYGTLSDLVERQEHGANKEGEELTWDDARRIVFHTLIVMQELDRTLVYSALPRS